VLVRVRGQRAAVRKKPAFRAGDIIVKINDKPVHDTGDFTRRRCIRETAVTP
jgi:S1-C subfamily serine protease